jgi:hypothetical protein
LDPSIDRSPWSAEETKQLIELFEKHGRMIEVKEIMNSRRSLKHMWSHYYINRFGTTREARDESLAKKQQERLAIKQASLSKEKPVENKI